MLHRILAAVALLCALASSAVAADSDGSRPDDRLTPGEIRSTDRHAICAHSTRTVRHVPVTLKVAARRAYGIVGERGGWCGAEGCEVDHRVPLVVGGGNTPGSIRNLWPQRADGPMGYHAKDRCEAKIGRLMCAGKLSVTEAQAVFLGDWVAGCAVFMDGR